jgi:hypothetical protein
MPVIRMEENVTTYWISYGNGNLVCAAPLIPQNCSPPLRRGLPPRTAAGVPTVLPLL